MRKLSVAVFGVVLLTGLLVSRETSARQPCRPYIENVDVKVEEVRIDGVLADKQPSADYSVDGGTPVRVTTASTVRLGDSPSESCALTTSTTFFMTVVDPFSGDSTQVMFEEAP